MESRDSDGAYTYVTSPRAGGDYAITGTAVAILNSADIPKRLQLTTWLCDQHNSGIPEPKITSDVLEKAWTRRLVTSERIERALLYFNKRVRVGQSIDIFVDNTFSNADPDASILAALTESATKDELVAVLDLIRSMGLLEDITEAIGRRSVTPTASGWLKIEELLSTQARGTQGFVAMWFNPSTEDTYAQGIAPGIEDAGYKPLRIDNKEHSNKIDDEIIAEIRRSRFLVADFTCEKGKVRGGVYKGSELVKGSEALLKVTAGRRC
jgi:hypothetical protein